MKAYKTILVLSLAICFIGCRDSDRDKDTSINSCADFGAGQSFSLDVFKLIHQAALSSKGITNANLTNTGTLFGCDTIIVDTVSIPMTITLQFNPGCTSGGNTREGEIVASFSSKYDNLGTQVNISFTNYSFNGHPISGTQRFTFNGVLNTNPTYGVTTTAMEIRDTINNRTLLFSGNQTLAITSGESTASFSDDTYSLSGSATGRAYAGNDFTARIDENLILKGSCTWVSAGTATISPENKQPRDLDFGSSCDNIGTARIYGLVYEVIFPE